MRRFSPGAIALVAIAIGLVATVGSGAAQGRPDSAGPPNGVIPDHYIVVLEGGVEPAAVAADHGLTPVHVYRHALNGFSGVVPSARLAALENDPRVAFVEADLEANAILHGNNFQTLPAGVTRIDADHNYTAQIDGVDDRVNVDVAVIDTGIDLNHPDLSVFQNKSFITKGGGGDDEGHGTEVAGSSGNDDNGHGTHVAGTIAALDNGIGVVGVAPGARLWALKVLDRNGRGSFSDVIAAIDYVTANASQIEVVNMSLGGTGRLDSLRTAIQNSVAVGVVYVTSAGNSSRDVYGGDGTFNTSDDAIPAAYPEVAAVSAMGDTDGQAGGLGPKTSYGTLDDTFASFTNFSRSVTPGNPVSSPGAAIDMAGPGVDILSTYKDGLYATISGTSMASPHVAGAAALHIAANGRATNAAGVAAIRQSLIDGAQAQSDWRTGSANDPDAYHEGLVNVASGSPPTLLSIAVTPASVSIVEGGTQQFTAMGTYSDSSTADITNDVTWTSSDVAVATVGAAGLASGVAAGTTIITASQGGVLSDSASLEVTGPPTLLSIALTPANPTVAAGQTQQFTAMGTYSDSSTAEITNDVTWTSSDVAVATVDDAGLAAGVSAGTTQITATQGTLSDSTSLRVTPPVLESISVTPTSASVEVGQTHQFAATGTYSDSSTASITASVAWTSVNLAIATVDAAGLASGVAAGTATITATLDSVTGYATLTVTATASADTVTITKATYNAKKGTLTVAATSSASGSVTLTVALFDSSSSPLGGGVMEYNSKRDKHKVTISGLVQKPFRVVVTSSGGGSAEVAGGGIGGKSN